MKKFFVILACLAIPLAMVAQERTGNISGTVVDADGNPLPGVTITLTGNTISPIQSVTSAEGRFRFLALFPGKDFQVKMELQGFKTRTETGIVVDLGKTSDLRLVMEVGKLEEQVTVVAQTPVVQAKKTQVQNNINYEMLQSLPSARDPWVMLQLTPSVFIDRENVGGTESGQMSAYQAKGATSQEWSVDGMQVTDLSSISAPSYFDFDAFEEMQVSTGMLDVEHKSGIIVNMVSRRGGNKTTLGGRFYYTDEAFQSEISPERMAELGIRYYNQAVDMKDFGFNAGGPIIKDKIWWWAAYGVQQINTINAAGTNDKTFLNNYTAKLNFQLIPENRAEFYFSAADKKKEGRDSSESFPQGYLQGSKFHFGNPTWKFQDEHMFGDNLFVSARFGVSHPGFGLIPGNDPDLEKYQIYDYTSGMYYNSEWYMYSDRPHPYGVFQVQYFSDNLFGTGTAHEMKLGVEINNNKIAYVGGNVGNFTLWENSPDELGDWDGDGNVDILPWLTRISVGNNDLEKTTGTKRFAAYFSDAISFGRFNVNAGLRLDRAIPFIEARTTTSLFKSDTPFTDDHLVNYADVVSNFWTSKTVDLLTSIMPTKSSPYIESAKIYTTVSPRLGVTYDLFGTGKTILKAAYSMYLGDGLGTGYWAKSGMYPWMDMYWDDANGDNKADYTELYWQNMDESTAPFYRLFDDAGNFQGDLTREYGTFWGGWDQANPQGLVDSKSYVNLDTWKPSQTHELFASVEHEIMQDFGVSLSYTWKRMGRMSWSQAYYPLAFYPTLNDHVRSKDDYEIGSYIPSTLVDPSTGKTYDPGAAAGRPWYVLKVGAETLPTSYTMTEMMDSDRRQIYWGFDLVFNKRLSNKWMMNGSFTYQMQRNYYGDYGYTDPTNMWAYEGNLYGISMGGSSGKVARDGFSTWMFKLTGLYQLPFDINVSGTLSAHQGYFYYTYFGIRDYTLPNSRSNSVSYIPTASFDNRTRLDDVWSVNLKIEKGFKLGEASRMYFSIDIFNVMNLDTILRRYDINLGTFRYAGSTPVSRTPASALGAGSGNVNDVMNPFIFRLGMRFQI